jgi:ubiquitin carboxyl-terminal hydrolase 9/13
MMKNKPIGPASPGAKPKPPGSSGNLAAQVGKEESKDSSEYKKKMALANGPIINMDFSNGDKYGMPESLFTSVKDLFESIIAHESRTGVVSPQKLLDILRKDNEIFRAPIHQDAHEFLNVLLNQAVENVEQYSKEVEARRSLDKSSDSETPSRDSSSSSVDAVSKSHAIPNTKWIHDLFEGTLTSETRCLTCENTSARDEAFLDLSVDLDVYSSVTSCLLKFSEEEMLCERNKFYCDQCCGLQEAEKRMKIKRLPKILALHLKRFKYTDELQRLHKLFHLVSYPYYLRLLNTTDDAEEPDRLYELYAVCVHIGGGPYHGHYVSIVKTQDRGWLLLDDENVEPVDKSFVLEFFGGEQNLACAYVLFYQETTVEAMHQEQEAEGKAYLSDPVVEANGKIHANGSANGAVPYPPSPLAESQEFTPLDRSVTAPVSPMKFTNGSAKQSTLEQVVGLPFLTRKKSVLMSKKDREREDKDKREADREMERLAQERKREAQASMSWAVGAKEDSSMPRKSLSTSSRASQLENQSRTATPQADRPERENGTGFFSGGMSRLKQTSKSFKGKQRLWSSSKNKPESAVAMPPPSFQPPAELPESHAVATHVLPPVSPYGPQPGAPADLLDRAVERREPPDPPERPERRAPPEPPERREPPERPERPEWPGSPEGRSPPRPPSRPPRPPPRRPPRPELLDPPDRPPPPQPTDEAAYRDKQLPAPPVSPPPPLPPRLQHALTTPSRISEDEVIRLRLQSRGETPITALPAMEAALGGGSGGRKKEKRGLWGLGKKKSVMGL